MSLTFRQIGDPLPKNQIGVLPWYPTSRDSDLLERVLGLSPLGFWYLRDSVAPPGLIVPDSSGNEFDGDYFAAGVTYGVAGPGDGFPAIALDGTGNVCLYSAGLAAVYNPAEVALSCWLQIAAPDWTDGDNRIALQFGPDGGNNRTFFRKSSTSNQFDFVHRGGGSLDIVNHTFSPQNTNWFNATITVSESANAGAGRMRAYINGVQTGADVSPIGTNVGGLNPNRAIVGATSCTGPGSTPFIGGVGRVMAFGRELTPSEVALIARI